jgi:hypothetical protein
LLLSAQVTSGSRAGPRDRMSHRPLHLHVQTIGRDGLQGKHPPLWSAGPL